MPGGEHLFKSTRPPLTLNAQRELAQLCGSLVKVKESSRPPRAVKATNELMEKLSSNAFATEALIGSDDIPKNELGSRELSQDVLEAF